MVTDTDGESRTSTTLSEERHSVSTRLDLSLGYWLDIVLKSKKRGLGSCQSYYDVERMRGSNYETYISVLCVYLRHSVCKKDILLFTDLHSFCLPHPYSLVPKDEEQLRLEKKLNMVTFLIKFR